MTDFISLFVIVVVAFIAPFISHLVPRSYLPEVVVLVAGGMIVGPNVLGLIEVTDAITLLSELGLAFLFLLAGYEIDINEVKGKKGAVALGAWILTMVLAFVAVSLVTDLSPMSYEGSAFVIALSATALGTIMPILKERELMQTPVGKAVLAHGTIGEVGPIIAMAILLSVRSTLETILLLLAFFAVAIVMALAPGPIRRSGKRIVDVFHWKAETTAQTSIRLTVVVLVGLVTLASVFELDVVLGAFAAGFIIRRAVPHGREELEKKLEGISYGFFIPLFFVVSGSSIDPAAVGENPGLLLGVLGLLLAVRATSVWISTFFSPNSAEYSRRERATIALYATTSLPMIVAVSHVAMSVNAMTQETASVLIAAGALSVLLMPFLAALSGAAVESAPVNFAIVQLRRRHRASRPTQQAKSRGEKVRQTGRTRKPEDPAPRKPRKKSTIATSSMPHGTSAPKVKKPTVKTATAAKNGTSTAKNVTGKVVPSSTDGTPKPGTGA